MTKRSTSACELPSCKRRRIEVDFSGGNVSSDAGVLLLRQADRRLGLTESVAKGLTDPRQKGRVEHNLLRLVRQRVYALALGYEDLNDHNSLKADLALQTAVEADSLLASASTLSRFENWVTCLPMLRINSVLVDAFIDSFDAPPGEVMLDFDTMPIITHGDQEGRFFNGHYGDYCFIPLYVFCGRHLLVAYLQPCSQGPAHRAAAVLKLLVKRIRAAWPKVRIVWRADSAFCKPRILAWSDRNGVDYIVGIQKNPTLDAFGAKWLDDAKEKFIKTQRQARLYGSFRYATRSWDCERRIILRAVHDSEGRNPRYIVTSLKGGRKHLYEKIYCSRGEFENRLKEQKSLFADRASAHVWRANQMRLLLSALAYTLVDAVRRLALKATEFSVAHAATIRLKLLKIGGVITRNTRRIRLMLSSACPYKDTFIAALKALGAT